MAEKISITKNHFTGNATNLRGTIAVEWINPFYRIVLAFKLMFGMTVEVPMRHIDMDSLEGTLHD